MAYPDGIQQMTMLTSAGVNSLLAVATTAVKRFRVYVGNDVVVKAVGIVNLSTKAGAVSLSWRASATAGVASVSGDEFARTTQATGSLKGDMTVRQNLNTTVCGGGEVVAQVRAAVTGMTLGAFIYVTNRPPDWRNKTSNTTLVTT